MARELSEWPCSIARAADVLGDAWTLVILRDCMYGVTRFDEFQRSLKIARNTLSDRLTKLVEAGVLAKEFYQDNPPRYAYRLTEMGYDLVPVLAAMLAWGDRWLDGGAGAPVRLVHDPCDHDLAVTVACAQCGGAVLVSDLQFCVGPGYPDDSTAGHDFADFRSRLASQPGREGGRPHAHRHQQPARVP